MSATGALLFDEAFLAHDPGRWHPESPSRLRAIMRRLHDRPNLTEALEMHVALRPASADDIVRVHDRDYLEFLQEIDVKGGGALDPDTILSSRSLDAALKAAGAGLEAVRLVQNGAPFAYCLVRPPGHHALPSRGMGFCLINNVAVAAAALRAQGRRVAIIDWDAHHGNGTQEIFYADPEVFFISLHEFPQYPGTGRISEIGRGEGAGRTINFPFPPGTGEATYLEAFETVIEPVLTDFLPDWILVSCGFDGHRADPITDLGLRAKSFEALMRRTRQLAAKLCQGRLVVFLEGGYDLQALADSTEATLAALLGERASIDEPDATGDGSPLARKVVRMARDNMLAYWSLT